MEHDSRLEVCVNINPDRDDMDQVAAGSKAKHFGLCFVHPRLKCRFSCYLTLRFHASTKL